MTAEELQKKINQFIDTLSDEESADWYVSDRSAGRTILNAFLWWAFPELKLKDLPSYDEWPLYKKEVNDG